MQGTVVQRRQRIGFIQHANFPNNLFFHLGDQPQGFTVSVGQVVEFDVDNSTGRDKAINMRVVGGAARQNNRQQQPAQQQRNQPIAVSWKFGEVVRNGRSRSLPIWVTLKKGKDLAVGIEVNYSNLTDTTDANGTVAFQVTLAKDQTDVNSSVVVEGKSYSFLHQVPGPKLVVSDCPGPDFKVLIAEYCEGKALVPVNLRIMQTNGSVLAWREPGQADWKIETGNFVVPSTGRIVMNIKIHQLAQGAGGEKIFVGIEGKADKSDAIYISRYDKVK